MSEFLLHEVDYREGRRVLFRVARRGREGRLAVKWRGRGEAWALRKEMKPD